MLIVCSSLNDNAIFILILDENTQSYSIKLVLILELSDWMSI